MGKNRKSSSVGGGKKRKGVTRVESCVSDVDGDSTGSESGEKGKGSRNGTIRHVYTTNSDMDCIEEYLKPVYKDGEVILEVECGSNKAMMYLSKLCQGSKGPCVEFQGSWLTPNEFQYVSGRETAKDWKRSIRHQGKSMKLLLTKGVLSVHSTVCDCEGCRVTSPVNRCRLAEKRRSVYSANRKERLTIESFTSCGASSLDGISDILDKPSEENAVISIKESKEIVSEKKISSKHCSPLRESRLSNIIEQLRSSKEREKSADSHAFKKDFYEDEKRTRDENGNEGDEDPDCGLSVAPAVTEEILEEGDKEPFSLEREPLSSEIEPLLAENQPVLPETDSLLSEKEPLLSETEPLLPEKEPLLSDKGHLLPEKEPLLPEETLLSDKEDLLPEEKPLLTEEEPLLTEEEPLLTEETILPEKQHLSPEKEPRVPELKQMSTETDLLLPVVPSVEQQQQPKPIKKGDADGEANPNESHVVVDNETPEEPLETPKESPDTTMQKDAEAKPEDKITSQEKEAAVEKPVLNGQNSSMKLPPVEHSTVEPTWRKEIAKSAESTSYLSDVKSAHLHVEKAKPSKPTSSVKERPKSPISSTHSVTRKEPRHEKESKARFLSARKSSPAAPTQSYSPAVSSCLTSLPASVPEQLFNGDVNGAKYSDFIRLLAASHLGGHLPLLRDRLMSENLQGYPLAPNFTGLPHSFPSYPFFPHPLHMKDTPHFQMPPMSMPPAFMPPYMYRPFGLFPHAFSDTTSQRLTPPADVQKAPPRESPTPNTNRKRVSSSSEVDSALDLSTKRSKLSEELVPRKDSYHSKKSSLKKSDSIRFENGAIDLGKSSRVNDRHGLLSHTSSALDALRRHSVHSECSCQSLKKDDIRLWSVSEVGKFLQTLDGCYVYADTFREHRVDGKSLPLLTVEHLMHNIGMKLGPAVLLTKTVAKRLKLTKQAHKKCPKCDITEMKSLQNYKLLSGQTV